MHNTRYICFKKNIDIFINYDKITEEKAKVETEVEKNKEEGKEKAEQNPSMAKTEKSHPSEPTFGSRKDTPHTRDSNDVRSRPSVRAQLKEIRAEQDKARAESKEIKPPTKKKSKKKGVKDNVRT